MGNEYPSAAWWVEFGKGAEYRRYLREVWTDLQVEYPMCRWLCNGYGVEIRYGVRPSRLEATTLWQDGELRAWRGAQVAEEPLVNPEGHVSSPVYISIEPDLEYASKLVELLPISRFCQGGS